MKKINVKGVIVFDDYKEIYDWYGIENTSVSDVVNELPTDNSPVEVIINSPGGMVDAGSEIYSQLKDYGGEVTAKIFAMAASAASVLAMGADIILIAPPAQMMIHNVSGGVTGDYRTMQKEATVLENYNNAIANAYVLKTGKTHDEIIQLMNQETFFTAQQAVEEGFADGVLFDMEMPKVASMTATLLPQAVIDKTRQMMSQQMNPNTVITNAVISDDQLQFIVNEVANKLNTVEPKEPEQVPVQNRNLSKLFLYS